MQDSGWFETGIVGAVLAGLSGVAGALTAVVRVSRSAAHIESRVGSIERDQQVSTDRLNSHSAEIRELQRSFDQNIAEMRGDLKHIREMLDRLYVNASVHSK